MKTGKQILSFLLVFCIVLSMAVWACAESSSLRMPENLKTIEEGAFYGDRSLNEVILPEGLKTIGSKAFANSSCGTVSFPKSLSYIAPDAFDNCSRFVGSAIEGSYAAAYLENSGLLYCLWEDPDAVKPEILRAWQSDTDELSVSWVAMPEADRYKIYRVDTVTQERTAISVNAQENTDGNVVTATDWLWSSDWHGENSVSFRITVQAIANDALIGLESDPVVVTMNKGVAVTGIDILSATSLRTGKTRLLTATISPENASNRNVLWSSSDESVAVVEDGLVTAIGMGSAVITATTQDGGYTDTCRVTVNMPTPEVTVLKNGGGKAGIFSWKAVPQAISYNLYSKNGSSGSWTFIENITDLSYTYILSNKYGKWSFGVAGVAADGTEGSRKNISMESQTMESAPVVALEQVTSTSLTLSWMPTEGADLYYIWLYEDVNEDPLFGATVSAEEELRCTAPGLLPGRTYTIDVFATFFDSVGGTKTTVTATTPGNSGSSEFVVYKGNETVIAQGQNSGAFACGTAAGQGDIATFTVSCTADWTVTSNANWMSVEKTNNNTAVVTIGEVEDGLRYEGDVVFTSGGRQYVMTLTLDKTGLSDRFVITKGSDTILASGSRTGYFTCSTAAGPGAVATFTVSSSNDWTVSSGGAAWMSVRKLNGTTAVMTIGEVEDGEKYNGTLTFTTANDSYRVFVTLDKTSLSNTPSFSGSFAYETKKLMLGDSWIVDASVSVNGGSGALGKVSVTALNHDNSIMTADFSSLNVSSVQLGRRGEFTVDTTKAPWNVPGTYTLRLWAKDSAGVGEAEPLAMMTLNIVEVDTDAEEPTLSFKSDVVGTDNSGNGKMTLTMTFTYTDELSVQLLKGSTPVQIADQWVSGTERVYDYEDFGLRKGELYSAAKQTRTVSPITIPKDTPTGEYILRVTARNRGGLTKTAQMSFKIIEAPANVVGNANNSSMELSHGNTSNVKGAGVFGGQEANTCHDYSCPTGTAIYAPYAGTYSAYQAYTTINNVKTLTSFGNYIAFTSSDGNVRMLFAHMDSFAGASLTIPSSRTEAQSGSDDKLTIIDRKSVLVKGTLLGESGNTGKSYGAHVHFEVQVKIDGTWKRVYPCAFFRGKIIPCATGTDPQNK